VSLAYEYLDSRGAHGEFVNNIFERMVEARRQVWFGSDGSGLIRSTRIGWSFFTEEQRVGWEAAVSREAREDRAPAICSHRDALAGMRAFWSTCPMMLINLPQHWRVRGG